MKELLKLAFEEDFALAGDITGEAIFTDETDEFVLIAKADGVLCGCNEFAEVFREIDKNVNLKFHFADGDKIIKGDVIVTVSGQVAAILKAERTALNFIGHLSGIATKTAEFVAAAGKSIILDTRKTLPGWRKLQKYAVRCGGGQNHRMGLFDMVMIKDNHIDAAGSIGKAVEIIRSKWGNKFKIEVETRNLAEVQEALTCQIDRIMLDNMDTETMRQAVELIGGKTETEASGNMTVERLPEVADTGVDFISV
ncbi:MAG TPA: carboxylating nicotinate-nucleotide diphosphorylase, partial [Candidatus Cloacimonadota bacterium]|nr:carboxylating nicotinate-nucleotide diphosphorylase [Candidatus Cloacimonadota bacterium]